MLLRNKMKRMTINATLEVQIRYCFDKRKTTQISLFNSSTKGGFTVFNS